MVLGLLRSMLPFRGLSVYLSCSCIVLNIDTISFAYDSPMSLPDYTKIRLTSINPFLPKLFPKVTTPVDLSVGDI